MAAIVARAEVVFELCAEFLGDGEVLDELGVSSIAVLHQETCGGDVLGDPVGVSRGAVVGGCEGGGVADVGDGTWEAILEETCGVYGGNDGDGALVGEGEGARWRRTCTRGCCGCVDRWSGRYGFRSFAQPIDGGGGGSTDGSGGSCHDGEGEFGHVGHALRISAEATEQ